MCANLSTYTSIPCRNSLEFRIDIEAPPISTFAYANKDEIVSQLTDGLTKLLKSFSERYIRASWAGANIFDVNASLALADIVGSEISLAEKTQLPEQKDALNAAPVTGRAVWDIVAEIWKRFGWWSIPWVVALSFACVAVSHLMTKPGESISLLGINLYTKGEASEIRDIPQIPGGAGWVFLGYYDPKIQGFTGVSVYRVVRSSFSNKAPLPREGEWLQLLAKREIIISNFQNNGTKLRDIAPWKIHPILLPEDETGLSLGKGSVVEVRRGCTRTVP